MALRNGVTVITPAQSEHKRQWDARQKAKLDGIAERQAAHDILTTNQKIDKCLSRGGEGGKEHTRLLAQLRKEDPCFNREG